MLPDNENEEPSIDTWMFRSGGEWVSLVFSLFLLLLVGLLFSLINLKFLLLVIVVGLIYVRLQQYYYLGDSIRVHQNQFSNIYRDFVTCAQKLGIRKANLYIKQDPNPNAWTLGIFTCTVVLTSALVEQLTEPELKFVIAHELGHFKAGHTKITSMISPLGGSNPFSNLIMGFYERQCEYTSDRCGLALTRDLDSATSALLKISIGGVLYKKLDIEGYQYQLRSAKGLSLSLGELLSNHPLTTNRVKSLAYFWKSYFINKN